MTSSENLESLVNPLKYLLARYKQTWNGFSLNIHEIRGLTRVNQKDQSHDLFVEKASGKICSQNQSSEPSLPAKCPHYPGNQNAGHPIELAHWSPS
jgi:hypothetical protein